MILLPYGLLVQQVWLNKSDFIDPKQHCFSCIDRSAQRPAPCAARVDHSGNFCPCVTAAVQGANPGPAKDAGSLWGALNH